VGVTKFNSTRCGYYYITLRDGSTHSCTPTTAMVLRLALCYTIALAAAPMMATFAAGSPQCTPPASVE
jgi:hypothetical protein